MANPDPKPATPSQGRELLGLHRYAVAVAVCTGLLVFAGGLVTSTGAGLSVPDWPLSYGQLMPPMVGNVRYEHGHRMVATFVGMLTIVLAVWLWRSEPRRGVRRLGVAALGAVVAQGLLGGLTVLLLLPTPVSVAHATLGQTFFCIVVSLALFTSPGWKRRPPRIEASPDSVSLRTLTLVLAAAVYLQLIVGAVMRHLGAGLAIEDFPLAQGRLIPAFTSAGIAVHYAHRVGALVVAACAAITVTCVLRRHARVPELSRPAILLLGLVTLQVGLGATSIWTRKAVVPTTLHVLTGALVLATSVVLMLRTHRLVGTAPRRAAVGTFAAGQVAT